MSFEQNLAEKTAYCEKVLIDMLPSVEGLTGTDRYASVVVDAMQYSVMAGGKRLRPLFVYETCRMYGGREELAAPFMAALEMIHNYSLVHDDMPAMIRAFAFSLEGANPLSTSSTSSLFFSFFITCCQLFRSCDQL